MAPSPNSSNSRQPAPPKRVGPRPLGLHLGTAMATWLSCAAVLPNSKPGSLKWHPSLAERAAALESERANHAPEKFRAAIQREARKRLAQFHDGLTRYRNTTYRRANDYPPPVWGEGTTRLYDYAPDAKPDARPVLLVPSLVNRAYVLDLDADNSLTRNLASRGFRPFLVDWAAPGDSEREFGLAGYIDIRLTKALAAVEAMTNIKPALVGYCMGGNLALGLATAHQSRLAGIALLATPWDFHAERADLAKGLADAIRPWWPMIDAIGELPLDLLQSLFAAQDPLLAAKKFRALSGLNADNPKFRAFVALEDWLNDGVPLTAPVAHETIEGWYAENRPATGKWTLSGRTVNPRAIQIPSFVAIPAQDRIVPPDSARALVGKLRGAYTIEPPLGHIGMVVGTRGRKELWDPLAAWLGDLPQG
jgi:polyhydroxyalkanoate synthase subunit PhaC